MEEQGKALLELSGSVEHVIYHNDKNQYTVLELAAGEGLVTVVGAFPFVSEGEELRIYGTWQSHPSFGDQFKAETFERARPATTAAMLKYLASGTVKGVGPSATRPWKSWRRTRNAWPRSRASPRKKPRPWGRS